MSTLTILMTVFFILLFLVLIVTIIRNTYYSHPYDDGGHDEYESSTHTHTTTTVTEEVVEPQYTIVGNLVRQVEGAQHYVMDPVDNEKIYVNASDDMYRDADGKIWKLL